MYEILTRLTIVLQNYIPPANRMQLFRTYYYALHTSELFRGLILIGRDSSDSPFYNRNSILAIYRRFGIKSFRHLDDSALDVSAPRRFGSILVNSPRRFGAKTFRHQGISAPDGWMDGWVDGLAVEIPSTHVYAWPAGLLYICTSSRICLYVHAYWLCLYCI